MLGFNVLECICKAAFTFWGREWNTQYEEPY